MNEETIIVKLDALHEDIAEIKTSLLHMANKSDKKIDNMNGRMRCLEVAQGRIWGIGAAIAAIITLSINFLLPLLKK